MAPDQDIGQYRRWYGRLLRLYPRPFQERFAEPMTQTFTDLCRERRQANRGIHAFALAMLAETLAQIMRENMTQLMQTKNYLRWVLVSALVLAVPALAMALRLGGGNEVAWGPMDFALIGVLVLGSGFLFEYASARAGNVAYRAAVGIAVAAALFLIWVNLAVGMIGNEGNSANLMYIFVLLVALAGAAIARFEPREASIAMFATAAAHAVVALIALIAGLGPTLPADAFFIGAWIASAVLFRRASVASASTT